MLEKIQQLQQFLTVHSLDLALLTQPDSITYYTNYACEQSERISALLIFPEQASSFFCPAIEFDLVRSSKWQGDYFGYTDNENPYEKLQNYLKESNLFPQNILIEETHLTLEREANLKEVFPLAKLFFGTKIVEQQRMIKTPAEQEIIKVAAQYADEAIAFLAENLKIGQTEQILIQLVEDFLRQKGIQQMAFPTSIYFEGETLQENTLVCIDLGVVYQNYCSDITRTLIFGQLNTEQKTIYSIVQTAQEAAIKQAVSGTPVSQLDHLARKVITDAGYGAFYPHRLGHGLGISGHEKPAISQRDHTLLAPGMVITIEPGIYVPGVAHVRLEDMLLITDTGNEALTHYPKKIAP